MKLIVEKINGEVYLYTETERHYKNVKDQRRSVGIKIEQLSNECDLSKFPDNCHFVFQLQK